MTVTALALVAKPRVKRVASETTSRHQLHGSNTLVLLPIPGLLSLPVLSQSLYDDLVHCAECVLGKCRKPTVDLVVQP